MMIWRVSLFWGILGVAILGFFFPGEVGAISPMKKNDPLPVTVEADKLSFDPDSGNYLADGEVFLQRGEWSLFSDHLKWNPDDDEASGEGQVRLIDKEGNSLSAESFELNLGTGKGRLHQGKAFLKENNFHLDAKELHRLDEKNFMAEEASFTTCDGDQPAWRFQARKVNVTLDDYARAKHVFFYLKDLPVLYFPYLFYPVSDRKSGFLIPRYGYSENRGMQIHQPFYWAISRSTDATFHLDYLSRLGLGKGVEYRYIAPNDNRGKFNLYHVTGLDEGGDRSAFSWEHDGVLPGRVRLVADVEYVDEKDFFEDFGQEAEEYNRETVESVIFAQRNWEKLNLGAQMKYIKDLRQSTDDIVQRLPEARFSLIRKRFGETPLFYGFDSSYNHFWRREGETGDRMLLRPYLAAVLKPGGLAELEAELGLTQRLYWTSEQDADDALVDFSVALSNRFSRIYHPDGKSIKKIRHVLQPEIRYSYIPPENQDEFPQFDHLDDIEPQNRLSYALINRLTARIEKEGREATYHEFLYFRLGQDFDIRESRRDRDPGDDPLRPFSAIRAEMILRPTTWSYLDVDGTYDMNPEREALDLLRIRTGVNDQHGNRIGIGYSFRDEEYEYLSGNLSLAVLDPLFLNYHGRYDLRDKGNDLEHVLNAEWRFQCWSLFVTFRDRTDDGGGREKEVMVSFALKGLGHMFGVL
ncbi:MAG: LPS-assembly protein LptD [Desulfuromonadaceae bacterium]|nr:LPS-assembly protein LptD [Desulfuromonadaceae bacterium]